MHCTIHIAEAHREDWKKERRESKHMQQIRCYVYMNEHVRSSWDNTDDENEKISVRHAMEYFLQF